ncbi:MAG TPA: sugar phosphate nucleotidyltransferase [Mycobacteriales bacterium]|nr:sugar phosphate nucleotidyltransferase [Mycobacteriales bacterium]
MQTVILCGGRGVRAWPATAEVPKPMLEVAGRPVLHHVMQIYAAQGCTDFVLATGYRGDVIARWAAGLTEGWTVTCLDTGDDTDTGDRIRACAERIDGVFMATYGDGLGDVDLHALRECHASHPGGATVTVVPLPSQYGTIDSDHDGRVTRFREKPVLHDHWINAGFMVFDPEVLLATSGSSLERDVLPAIGSSGGLYVYRHEGFWRSMDTHKDAVDLNTLAVEEGAPWLTLPTR